MTDKLTKKELDQITTIPLKKGTRQRLGEYTGKGQSYDKAINHLLDVVGKKKKS